MFKELFVEAVKYNSNFEKDFDVLFRNLGYKVKRDEGLDNLLVYDKPSSPSIYIQDQPNKREITVRLSSQEWKPKLDFLVKKYKGKYNKAENTFIFPAGVK